MSIYWRQGEQGAEIVWLGEIAYAGHCLAFGGETLPRIAAVCRLI